jgi:hypothetical protein
MLDWERRYKKQQEDLQHYQEFVNKVGELRRRRRRGKRGGSCSGQPTVATTVTAPPCR